MTIVLVLGSMPGLVAAETAIADSYVVEEGETVDGLEVVGATVVVRGTVDGDLSGLAADVTVAETGVVTGDVNVAAANVDIAGRVDGDVSAAGASVVLAETAVVGGEFRVGASDVRIAGNVAGNVVVGADTIRVAPTAVVGGDLRYDGDISGAESASVAGSVVRDESIGGVNVGVDVAPWVVDGALAVYGFVANLLLGAALLLVLPGFSRAVADRAVTDPLRSGGVGLLTVVGVPVLLVLLVLTLVGIPFAVAGAVLFGLFAWVALVYGRFALGSWLVARAGGDNRWVALTVGLLLGALFGLLPIVGGLVDGIVSLVGLGALVLVLYARYGRGSREEPAAEAGEDVDSGGVPPAA
ncbi:bactofilin family protein [Haloarchaeobius litoreus]|uniref:Polymer-forming cytoskeletal protein n=1 Tax=Haloarchaeobius litoreus TaxID=755306 RepID=A0ABD6DK62_9EURY|nr:polymer-forming cytoskeletal protein [Haloarchaeobius litoreus]